MARSVSPLLLAATLLLGGCGEQAEVLDLGPVEMPPEHETLAEPPAAAPQGPRQVALPAELAGRFSHVSVTLQLPGAEPLLLELPLDGQPHTLAAGTLLARDYLPAFMIGGGNITSDGLEEKNPAVFIEWQHQGKRIFSGWSFRDYPELNPLSEPGYRLQLLSAR